MGRGRVMMMKRFLGSLEPPLPDACRRAHALHFPQPLRAGHGVRLQDLISAMAWLCRAPHGDWRQQGCPKPTPMDGCGHGIGWCLPST